MKELLIKHWQKIINLGYFSCVMSVIFSIFFSAANLAYIFLLVQMILLLLGLYGQNQEYKKKDEYW